MYNNSFFKQILLVATVLFLASCDKDYNQIGADLIGENHFDLNKYISNVVAYNQETGVIQSDNLPVNALGIYDNPAFGKTTASFVTQLELATVNPTININLHPTIESVVLTIPYFVDASKTTPKTEGGNTYVLDSIYGENNAKIKLSIYESGYYMRALDPDDNLQSTQKYYNNQPDFETNKKGNRLNDDVNVAQNDEFFFDNSQYVETTTVDGKETKTYTPPGMRLNLNAAFFDSKIIHAPSGKLVTNDVFKEYFRGLYFKVEQSKSDAGSLAMMDFSKGTITIKYKEDASLTDATTKVNKSIVLNLTGNRVSLLQNSDTTSAYSTALSTANSTLGDEKLYLKGGQGSMAVIELFGKTDNFGNDGITGSPNGVADELDIIRKNGWLINEANLVFNIDANAMANSNEPQRIYLYDLNNNRPITDYYNDYTSGTTSKKGKTIFDGRLTKGAGANGRGLFYKIRITDQIRGLVKNVDSTNVKLGVVVTEDINNVASNKFKDQSGSVKQAPRASVMNPLGTILYGSKSTVPEDKRLKLEIYYTKPN